MGCTPHTLNACSHPCRFQTCTLLHVQLDSLEIDTDVLADMAVAELRSRLLLPVGRDVRVVVARGTASGSADRDPVISVVKVGGHSLKRKGWSTGNVLYTPSGGGRGASWGLGRKSSLDTLTPRRL